MSTADLPQQSEPLATRTPAEKLAGVMEKHVAVTMSQQEINHVAVWLRASTMPMREDDPSLLEAWLHTPVGQFYSRIKELADG